MKSILNDVLGGVRLSREAMRGWIAEVLAGTVSPAQVAGMLTALRVRGETVDELVGAVEAVRAAAVPVSVLGPVVDTCGTGGDGTATLNISTGAAIVASAAGVTVAKHGNRSVSSQCGSADVLEAMGVRLDFSPVQLATLIQQTRLGFLFAPAHHPAFRQVAQVRKELAVRTLFNLVGPLANPAGAKRQVVGVFNESLVPLMAQVLHHLGAEHALVVHGSGLDEVSVCGPTTAIEVTPAGLTSHQLTPASMGLSTHSIEALRGGDAATNARLLQEVLEGAVNPARDAVLANAGAALWVGGTVPSLVDGVMLAQETIDSGAAQAHFFRFLKAQTGATTLDEIVSRLPAQRHRTPSRRTRERSLRQALTLGTAPRIIAEIKRKSPGAGHIADIVDPAALAQQYVAAGARAISVLTNGADFGGSLADLAAVRSAVSVPVLRKEFVVDHRQLDEACEAGADAILLIVALLGPGLARMLRAAESRGLECLVEVHDQLELRAAIEAGASIIGINNRNLSTLQVDLSVCEQLAPSAPKDRVLVAESGIRSPADLERLQAHGLNNFLVGEYLVRGGQL